MGVNVEPAVGWKRLEVDCTRQEWLKECDVPKSLKWFVTGP
jgi:hypothetical protein